MGIYTPNQLPPNGSPEYNYILGLLEVLHSRQKKTNITAANITEFRRLADRAEQGIITNWQGIVPGTTVSSTTSYMAAIKKLHDIILASLCLPKSIMSLILAAARNIHDIRSRDSGHGNVTRFWADEITRLRPRIGKLQCRTRPYTFVLM
uniref:Uncharacterized protein n=1 Tax=Plectus sambesii TaxID=2011161 RepID=A0A914VYG9_9BILA